MGRIMKVPPGTKLTDWVAIILAIGICTGLNLFIVAVLYDAIFSSESGLSENSTQILTGWGGGIIGILGAVFGYQAGSESGGGRRIPPDEPPALDDLEPAAYVPE